MTTKVSGKEQTAEEVVASKKTTSWMTGQSFQTQSQMGGFMKIRDVAKNSF